MKLLFVTPYLPSPPRFGGQRRLDGLMRRLAERHEITVLSFNRTDEFADKAMRETQSYAAVYAFDNLDSDDDRLKRRRQLRSLGSRHTYEYNLLRHRQDFQAQLDSLLESQTFDIIQVEFCTLAGLDFSRRSPRTRLVLDEHNIEYDLQRRAAEATQGVRRVYNQVNWRKLRHEEHDAWKRFDGVVLTSSRDESVLLKAIPGAKTKVVPNAADVDEFVPVETEPVPKRMLFFGALNYYPNEDGVTYFLDMILPLIVARHPDARIALVGPGAQESIVRRVSGNVELLGFVDDVKSHIDQAAVVVVPLRVGGGTRLKIVEAMAKGKALVSTSLGAEGINISDNTHVLIADDPAAFADAVCRLFDEPALARQLGQAARARAVEQYSWRAAASQLEEFYDALSPTE